MAAETNYLLSVTGRSTIQDAVHWIAEGRNLQQVDRPDLLLSALLNVDARAVDDAIKTVVRIAATSGVDSSTDLFAIDEVALPGDLEQALGTVADATNSRSLADISPEAVIYAQSRNSAVVPTLGLVAGLSWRDVQDRAASERGEALPSRPDADWTSDQIRAAFAVIDDVVMNRGTAHLAGAVPARPVEHMLSSSKENGWHLVERFRTEGVSYATLLVQRSVGGAWLSHRSSTTSMLSKSIVEAVCAELIERNVRHSRVSGATGDLSKKAAAELLGGGPGQVQVVVRNVDGTAALAIAMSGARDGGTARKNGGRLEKLPSELSVPAAAVVTGPGWVERTETGDLARAFGGRLFSDATLHGLGQLAAELVGADRRNND